MANLDYEKLATAIRQCNEDCIFRNDQIAPLAPRLTQVPVAVMFIGENPSWAESQDEPFDSGTISGIALEEYYLNPLNLKRNEVWITDIIKCRYPKNIYRAKAKHEKDIQEVADRCSRLWLAKEISFARPAVVITLSDTQVYQRLRKAFTLNVPLPFKRAVGKPHTVEMEGFETILFPMIHPDVSRPTEDGDSRKINVRRKWSPLHREHISALQELLNRISASQSR